jgi:alpha-glucosidase (family GH31 glycosyl hydrolase)
VDERVAADVAQLPQSLERFHMDRAGEILLEARGLDLYVFGGPSLREVVQRYNLFAGGGPLVPPWGLGFWYRAFGSANQQEILALAEDLRKGGVALRCAGARTRMAVSFLFVLLHLERKFSEAARNARRPEG